jgi:hypothetical protein
LSVLLCRARPQNLNSIPPSFVPNASHTAAMNSFWDVIPAYHLNEPQHPNPFAESNVPSVPAYHANLDLPNLDPQIRPPDATTIFDILLMHVNFREVGPIADYLERYFRSTPSPITGFRAGVVKLFNDEKVWPIVEWREGHDTDVLAIFKFMGPGTPCGCLMHYGNGIEWGVRKRWRESSLMWQVAAIVDLCDLFMVAQHILGILHWSNEDIANLYLKDCPENCSNEQYYSP